MIGPLHIVICFGPAHEDDALRLAQRLFARFDEAIDALALVPVTGDEFSLLLNGQTVHSLAASGTLPRVADVIAAMAAQP